MLSRLALVCLLAWLPAAAQLQELEKLFVDSQDLMLAGEYAAAREGFEKAWRGFAREQGEGARRTIEARIFHGQTLTMTGKNEEAMDVLGPVANGDTHIARIARASFALALRQVGQLERATKMLRDLVREFPSEPADNLLHLARMHSELAVCLGYSGSYKEAEGHARRALALLDKAGNPVPGHRATVRIILGQVYLLAGRMREAKDTFAAARAEALPFWGAGHPELGILEGAMGLIAYREGRYAEAETHTRAAIAAVRKMLGDDHPEIAMMTGQLAAIMKKLKRKDEERALASEARAIMSRSQALTGARVSAWSWREVK